MTVTFSSVWMFVTVMFFAVIGFVVVGSAILVLAIDVLDRVQLKATLRRMRKLHKERGY